MNQVDEKKYGDEATILRLRRRIHNGMALTIATALIGLLGGLVLAWRQHPDALMVLGFSASLLALGEGIQFWRAL